MTCSTEVFETIVEDQETKAERSIIKLYNNIADFQQVPHCKQKEEASKAIKHIPLNLL